MGKSQGFLTPKAISNRIKARGLQKLKWYCQMCEKQCRDENGFKCHTQSEGHLRQMAVFKSNSGKMISDFSRSFEGEFLRILGSTNNSTWVKANSIYQDLIRDKQHVHMNATRFGTLSGFVSYLTATGKVEMEERDTGIYIKYINKGFGANLTDKSEELERKRRLEESEDDKKHKEYKRLIELEKEFEKGNNRSENIQSSEPPPHSFEKLPIELNLVSGNKKSSKIVKRVKPNTSERLSHEGHVTENVGSNAAVLKRPMTAIERLKEELERNKREFQRSN